MKSENGYIKVRSQLRRAKGSPSGAWLQECDRKQIPWVVVFTGRRWTTVAYDLYHLTGELTKQGYDAFQRLLSDYAKDRKIGLGASGFSHVVGDIRVKVEYADDFAASLVRQFNEPGNVEVETFDDIVTNAAHCGTRKRTPYIEFKKEMV